MTLSDLAQYDLLYVGTPYTKYPGGIERAFVDACKLTGRLLTNGLNVYSPIAHTHPVAIHAGIDPLDHTIWLPFDQSMMDVSDAMIVAMMEGWETSYGVKHEIETFQRAGKLVFYLDPKSLAVGMHPFSKPGIPNHDGPPRD